MVIIHQAQSSSRRPRREPNPRIETVQSDLKDKGLDAALFSDPKNIGYLTNFSPPGADPEEAFFVVTPDHTALFTTPFYEDKAKREAPDVPLTVSTGSGSFEKFLADHLKGVQRLGVEKDSLSANRGEWLKEHFPATLLDPQLAEKQRRIKSPEEIAAMRKAITITANAMKEVALTAKPGVSEKQLATTFKKSLLDQGAEEAFTTIMAAGAHGAEPHFDEPSDAPIQDGDVIVMDVGAKIDGYNSDMTRMIVVGQPSAEAKEILDLVENAQRAGIDKVAPGVPLRDIDKAARDVIEQAGHGPDFFHSTGHGIGRDVHEEPYVSYKTDAAEVAQPGEVITIEPGVYLKGRFGVRIEDMVLVTADGHETLSENGIPKVFYSGG